MTPPDSLSDLTTQTIIPSEELAAMLAGLEGVTPGPWMPEMHQDEEEDIPAFYVSSEETSCDLTVVARMGDMSDNGRDDAAHIARCDPDTIRAIITELLSLRTSGAVPAVGEAAAYMLPVTNEVLGRTGWAFYSRPAPPADYEAGEYEAHVASIKGAIPLYTHPLPSTEPSEAMVDALQDALAEYLDEVPNRANTRKALRAALNESHSK